MHNKIWKLDESYPCKLVPATRRTRNSGLPSRTLSSRMFAKSYPRRVVPATGRTLELVPYFNIISTLIFSLENCSFCFVYCLF